jgi:Restriction endonuclease
MSASQQSLMKPPTPIFAWRSVPEFGEGPEGRRVWALDGYRSVLHIPRFGCRFCGELLIKTYEEPSPVTARLAEEWEDEKSDREHGYGWGMGCGFCGWGTVTQGADSRINVLRALDSNAVSLTFEELQAAIGAQPARAFDLSPRRFEELVASVFASSGFTVQITASSKDGGKDLVVLQASDEVAAIVEVKRWRRPIGVELVRQLRGVQLGEGVPHAVLVTASSYTRGAHEAAALTRPTLSGFTMELRTISDLLESLGLLSEPLQSPAAIRRNREEYTAWLYAQFGDGVSVGPYRRDRDIPGGMRWHDDPDP